MLLITTRLTSGSICAEVRGFRKVGNVIVNGGLVVCGLQVIDSRCGEECAYGAF